MGVAFHSSHESGTISRKPNTIQAKTLFAKALFLWKEQYVSEIEVLPKAITNHLNSNYAPYLLLQGFPQCWTPQANFLGRVPSRAR